jgi:hypothetical protein
MRKVKVSERSTVKHLVAVESELFRDLMPIVEFGCMLQYDDGSPRQPGYVGFWSNGLSWFARATDKDADATLTTEGRTLDDALQLLSLMLGAEDAPWVSNPRKKRK